jgi:hypothetical protein
LDGKNGLVLERRCSEFKREQINSLGYFQNSSFLIVTDQRGNISQIDLSTGLLLDSLNVKPYLANKANVAMSILLNNQTSYYLYNSANSAIFYATVTPIDTQNKVVLSCLNLHYYNNTLQSCASCSSSCATCDSLTGECSGCVEQYFVADGECLSCFYDSRGLTEHFTDCFGSNEQQVMETSEAMVSFMAVVVGNFATVLNLLGLLFMFLKLVNNWNIICLYFFVQMEIPFFLENVLKMIYTSLGGSVVEAIGINFKPSLQTVNRATAPKF